MAKSYLDREGLKGEAAVTIVRIARGLAGQRRKASLTALDEVLAAPVSDAARNCASTIAASPAGGSRAS